jgi:hypothetical protein
MANAELGDFLEAATGDPHSPGVEHWLQWAASDGLPGAYLAIAEWMVAFGDEEALLYYISAAERGVTVAVVRAQSYFDATRSRDKAAFCVGHDAAALGELGVGIHEGDAWALATHTWLALVRDEYELGLDRLSSERGTRPGLEGDALERCRQVLNAFATAFPDSTYHRRFAAEFADARCFAALLELASGKPAASSAAVWEDLARIGHTPSALFLAVSALRAGKREESRRRVQALTNDEVSILRERFVWPSHRGSNWLASWAKDCDEVLWFDYDERFS